MKVLQAENELLEHFKKEFDFDTLIWPPNDHLNWPP
jgi:hypothetical protein